MTRSESSTQAYATPVVGFSASIVEKPYAIRVVPEGSVAINLGGSVTNSPCQSSRDVIHALLSGLSGVNVSHRSGSPNFSTMDLPVVSGGRAALNFSNVPCQGRGSRGTTHEVVSSPASTAVSNARH